MFASSLNGSSSTSTASSRLGTRRNSVSNTIWSSIRARFWPRHWCGSKPNATWWRAALDVVLVRVLEGLRVPVGRIGQRQHSFACADQLPVDLDVLDAQPGRRHVDDREVPQHLLDRVERFGGIGLRFQCQYRITRAFTPTNASRHRHAHCGHRNSETPLVTVISGKRQISLVVTPGAGSLGRRQLPRHRG